MIEFLNSFVAWWHWVIIGFVFLISELATLIFVFLAFGIASILVGVIDLFLSTDINAELLIWSLLSAIIIIIKYLFFKKKDVFHIGQSSHMLETMGEVSQKIEANRVGKVIFDRPFLGSKEWSASSTEDLAVGERVQIFEVKGQLIFVVKYDEEIS
ncbi:MAG: NfeD family protein [Campylobacterota bacterium]|nr:NfeD family protein [Campylobacterota bacterium]